MREHDRPDGDGADTGDGVPGELSYGDTRRLDAVELVDLIEQSEGHEVAQRFAAGTPKLGMPRLEDEPVQLAQGSVAEPLPVRPVKQPSRLVDLAIGGSISLVAMIAWYCATQL